MASEETLRLAVAVADRTAGPLQAIGERFRGLQERVRGVAESVRRLDEETGFARLREGLHGVHERADGVLKSISSILPALAGLGAGLSAGEFAESIRQAGEFDEHLELISKTAGIAAQSLAGLEYAAKLKDVDTSQLDKGIQRLNVNIAEAARGKAKDVEQILTRMGATNTPGHLVSTAEALARISNEAQKLVAGGHTQTANDMMSKLFGERSGMQLLPLFAQGWGKIGEAQKEAMALGVAPNEAAVKAGAKFADEMKVMNTAITGLRQSIADALIPVLSPVIDQTTKWISANREWIATDISGGIRNVIDTLEGVDWSGPATALRLFGDAARFVFDHLTAVTYIAAGVAGLKFVGATYELGKLGVEAAGVALRFTAIPVARLIGSFAGLVPTITGVGTAFRALGVAMAANPLGAAIVAGTALAAAGYLIYQNWGPIKAFFKQLWADVVADFNWAWNEIKPIAVGAIAAAGNEICKDWQSVKAFFKQLWADVVADFDWAWNEIKPIVDRVEGAASWFGEHLGLGGGAARATAPSGPFPQNRVGLANRLIGEAASLGVDRPHALAMLGNSYAESGLNPLIVNPQSGAAGLFQWTQDRLARAHQVLGNRWSDPVAQFDYAIREQRNRDRGWFSRTDDLTNSFNNEFEVSGAGDRNAFTNQLSAALSRPILGRTAQNTAVTKPASHQLTVKFSNAPPGMSVTHDVRSEGDLDLDLGTGMAFAQ